MRTLQTEPGTTSISRYLVQTLLLVLVPLFVLSAISVLSNYYLVEINHYSKSGNKLENNLHILFQGLNESLLTEGAAASIPVAKNAIEQFQSIHIEMLAECEILPESCQLLEQMASQWVGVEKASGLFMQLNAVDKEDDATMMAYGRLLNDAQSLFSSVEKLAAMVDKEANKMALHSAIIISTSVAVVLFIVVFAFLRIYKSIATPLKDMSNSLVDIVSHEEHLIANLRSYYQNGGKEQSNQSGLKRTEILTLGQAFKQMAGVVVEHFDERQSAEQEVRDANRLLQSSMSRIRSIIDTAADGIILIDSAGVIREFSPAAERIFGYNKHETIAQDMGILVPDNCKDKLKEGLVKSLKGEDSNTLVGQQEFTGIDKNGRKFPMDLSIAEAVICDERYFTCIVRDITELKESQQAMSVAKEAAEASNRAKSDFLANMSHEIRTPMNAIIGMSHLALQTDLNTKQHNYIEKVHYSAENLLGIINDILDFSKIEANKLEMESADFYLDDVVNNLKNLVGLKAEDKGVQLTINIDNDVPTALIGDSLRLGQTLINLANNAVKFSDNGGQVVVSADVLDEDEDNVNFHFSIQDTGIGMTLEQQENLFQPFVQADTSMTRQYGGTGLGLVISKTLTEMMGGEIWFESKEGVGSTFHFTARLAKQQGLPSKRRGVSIEDQKILHEAISKLRGAKLLLVEDNEINQELALELLVANGLSVEVVNNGQEALELLDVQEFDGVLMDCQMPIMDGYTATRKLREQGAHKNLPVIAMTANAMAGDRDKALECGMNDHIAKPINVMDMFNTLAQWVTPNQPITTPKITVSQNDSPVDSDLLPELPGIDTQAGLDVSLGNVDIYRRLLVNFRNHYRNFESLFRAAQADDNDSDAAMRAAHSLKGVAGTTGAFGVQKAAALLESSCERDATDIDEQLALLLIELEPVIAGLDVLESSKPEAPSTTPEKFTITAVAPLFRELHALISNDNTAASDVVMKLVQMLRGSEFSKQLQAVKMAVEGYDFDEALETLERLLDALDIEL